MRKHLLRLHRGHRRRPDAGGHGERPGRTQGGPGRQPDLQGQRLHLAVQAAPARAGADRGDPQRPNRNGRRQPSPRDRERDRRLRREHRDQRQGAAGLQPGEAGGALRPDAKKACSDAIVGTGKGEVEVTFPEQAPLEATGPITLFNGGVRGGTTLLFIHTYVNVPAPTAVIATVELTRIHRGHYGTHAVAQIPRIAGGAGSVTKFKLTINRTFTYKGEKESYLTASCPTGSYYAEGKVQFSDATTLKVTHVLPCTPRD